MTDPTPLAALLSTILADIHPCVCSDDYTGRHLIAPECIHHDTPDEAEWVAARLIAAGVRMESDAPAPLREAIEAIDHPCHDLCGPWGKDGAMLHADCQCAAWVRQEALRAALATPDPKEADRE